MEKRSTVRQSLRPQINNITFDQGTHFPDIAHHTHAHGEQDSQKKGKLLKTSLFRNNSRPQFNSLSNEFSDTSVNKFIGDELSIVRVGPDVRTRAVEEMTRIRQRQIVSDEERVRLVEAALSLDAPKVARAAIRESQQIERMTARSNASPFLTFDLPTSSQRDSEDEIFVKVVDEVERTRRRMIMRANSNTSTAGTQQQAKTAYRDDVAASLEGLVGGGVDSDDTLTASARSRKLERLAAEIRNSHEPQESRPEEIKYGEDIDQMLFEKSSIVVRPKANTSTSDHFSIYPTKDSFRPYESSYHSGDRDSESSIEECVTHTPRLVTGSLSPRPRVLLIANDLGKGEAPLSESNSKKARNQHLKVLMQGSLRDWLSLECQVPMGPLSMVKEESAKTEDYVYLPDSHWSSPGLRKALDTDPDLFGQETTRASLDHDLDATTERPSPVVHNREMKIKIYNTSDITKSLSSLQSLIIDGDASDSSEGIPTPHTRGTRSGQSHSQSQLIYRMNSDSDLRTSAKQEEAPFHTLSHALKLLENTLMSIADCDRHQLPSLPGPHDVQSAETSDFQFRSRFRRALWASTLAGAAAGDFIADTVAMRHCSLAGDRDN